MGRADDARPKRRNSAQPDRLCSAKLLCAQFRRSRSCVNQFTYGIGVACHIGVTLFGKPPMTAQKLLLLQRIQQELALLKFEDADHSDDENPERAWMNGAAWMAEKIAQLLEDESEDAAALLKKMSLSPVCLKQAAEQAKTDA